MPDYPFSLEFYEEAGDEPVLRWMREDLSPSERRTIGLAMRRYLQKEGAVLSKNRALCEPVGDGVFEFKLRYNLKDLTSRLGLPYKPTGAEDTQNVMLRVFFHQHGSEIVLPLHGYDKGKNPGKRHQQAQIRLAKERKNKWIARKAREAKQVIFSAEVPASAQNTKKKARRKKK